MPLQEVEAGHLWGGVNKRSDPVDIPPEASPDCENAFLIVKLGLLGPRKGKKYAGFAAQRIVGVEPYRIGGQDLKIVAMSNGTTDVYSSYNSATPGGGLSPWPPPTPPGGGATVDDGGGMIQIILNPNGQVGGVNVNGLSTTVDYVKWPLTWDPVTCQLTATKGTLVFVKGLLDVSV